jgi:hypothetical protein
VHDSISGVRIPRWCGDESCCVSGQSIGPVVRESRELPCGYWVRMLGRQYEYIHSVAFPEDSPSLGPLARPAWSCLDDVRLPGERSLSDGHSSGLGRMGGGPGGGCQDRSRSTDAAVVGGAGHVRCDLPGRRTSQSIAYRRGVEGAALPYEPGASAVARDGNVRVGRSAGARSLSAFGKECSLGVPGASRVEAELGRRV